MRAQIYWKDGGNKKHYQSTFTPLLYGVAIAMILMLLLKETVSAVRKEN